MPSWLDEDLPPDIGDDAQCFWDDDLVAIAAQAEIDVAEQEAVHAHAVAAGIETVYAHIPGSPALAMVCSCPAGGFAQGQLLDEAPPEAGLSIAADRASGVSDTTSGPSRDFPRVNDDELFGLLGARQRLESRQAWERLAVIAEIIRRRPAPGTQATGPARMPRVWSEGTAGEVSLQLAISRTHADQLLALAWDLWVKLPATSGRLRDGLLDEYKATVIARHCANLTPDEARRAEQILFAQPGTQTMTAGMIRDRIARAVMEVNPDAARKRREDAARHDARIATGIEDTGNMMIAGRELPPAAVLAMDQAISARARELRTAGVTGSVRELRVLAFLERMGAANPVANLATAETRGTDANDSRSNDGGGADDNGPSGGGSLPGGAGRNGGSSGHPPGSNTPVAATVHLTVPVTTLIDLADRPGTLRGAGPIDPAEARDLADAAAASGHTTWECTITGPDGRPVAHACGKPAPVGLPRRRAGPPGPDPPPPRPPGAHEPPIFSRIGDGPDPRYGTWRYRHGGQEMIFSFEHLAGPCDHKHQAAGHHPGQHLRHLTAILNQHCTHPACRTPERQCDYEHSVPYKQGGLTCLCQAGPVCRRDHRDKQRPGWKLEAAGERGWFRWTTPSGRSYLSGPTEYPS